MAKPYSIDLRALAMLAWSLVKTTREVAAALRVAVSSVVNWAARKRLSDSVAPGKMGGHRRRQRFLTDGLSGISRGRSSPHAHWLHGPHAGHE